MRLEELDFNFPQELVAQYPAEPRDSCRLMHLPPGNRVEHRLFVELPTLLRSGDTLVLNDSRVLPARVKAVKPTGGQVEVLFLQRLGLTGDQPALLRHDDADGQTGDEVWEVLARPSHRLKSGSILQLPQGEEMVLRTPLGEGRWLLEAANGACLTDIMAQYGSMPLPPYIQTYQGDPGGYQTVYARCPGSSAAPTAGLHFTSELLEALQESGVGLAYVTLHVGLDTFQPIREEVVEGHRIHRETYSVSAEALEMLRCARRRGGRLVAIGTTAARVLETLAGAGELSTDDQPASSPVVGSTELFITPGYEFRAVDVLLTNFHLPRSTVLALTMAFAGTERLRRAYEEAIRLRYRLFSFGDAMLVERLDGTGPPTRAEG